MPDVVVIGAGIVGVSTAATLAEHGAEVVLVEREAIGAAASGRNSGVIQHPFDPVLAGLHVESLALYRTLAEATVGLPEPFQMGAEPAGLLLVSTDHEGTRGLAVDLLAGVPHLRPVFLDSEELRRMEPSVAEGVVACRLDVGYPVEPGSATRAYAELARGRGARIVTGTPADLWVEGDRLLGVSTREERISAGAVVVAAGPWTAQLLDPAGRWRPIVPSWGVIVELELQRAPGHVLEEAEIDAAIEPPGAGAEMKLADVAFSLVTAHGRSSLGSTFLPSQPDPASYVPAIVGRGVRFVPEIAVAAESVGDRAVRVCPRPVSRDGRPLVGEVPWLEGLYVAAGNGPWGISTGPATGRLIADLVLGRRSEIPAALSPERFGQP